ncbi:MAG TPA: hypothetical protein ACFYDZ_07975 [Candidatus Brocadiaceae bacterium]
MKTVKLSVFFVVCIFFIPRLSHAGDFDGSKPLLFSVKSVIECSPNGESRLVTAEEVNLPQFMIIDFNKKIITPLTESKGNSNTAIKRMESIDGKLILQGAEEGIEKIRNVIGWTASISEDTGKTVVTVSGDDVAFVVFGACLPR